jgi:heptosyltransferase-3
VIDGRPLRTVAALAARATLVITTDSGPMHLAVALDRPTIALLQVERSVRFQPRGPADRALMRASVADVLDAIAAHPQWSRLADDPPRSTAV